MGNDMDKLECNTCGKGTCPYCLECVVFCVCVRQEVKK